VQTGGPGLGEERLSPPRPVPGRNLVEGTKKGHGTIAVADNIGSALLLHPVEVGAQLGLKLARLYFHMTNIVMLFI